MESKKESKLGFVFPLMIYLGILAMGIVGGMMLQQAIFQATLMKVADNLEGVQIDIDLNETIMIDAMMDSFEEMGLFNYTNETNDVVYTEGEK